MITIAAGAVLIPLVMLLGLAVVVFAVGGADAFAAIVALAIVVGLAGGALWLTRIVLDRRRRRAAS